jgi:pimeloyl-ACP methyl ester carboxylesterase
MRTVRKRYVDIAEGQVHLHEAGGCDPPILLLHQTASSAKVYDPLLATLPLPNRLVAIDTPGFGGSFHPEGRPPLDAYAAQILAAADALGIDRFHLFGHHTGASLAIEIAAHAPGRIVSLMLAGPVFMTPEERASFIAGYDAPITPQRDGSHMARNWNYAASQNPSVAIDVLQDAVADLLSAWKARPQAYMAVAHHDTAARAKQVLAPVMLSTTPGDFFRANFDRAQAIFPAATCTETGGDNFPGAADPEGLGRAIAAFVHAHPD